jgi:photosystem II stability/assembly factor-like uncharacterized protein
VAAAGALALLTACGGSDGSDGTDGAAGASGLAVLVAVAAEPAGTHCAAGGQRIASGLDGDGNGVLDAAEAVNTQYVCHGTTGAAGAVGAAGSTGLAGATGAAGVSGAAALTALVQTSAEPVGIHCPAGGTKVSAGLDANASGVLDFSEVTSVAYVCGGTNGTNGVNGTNGSNGATGSPGASGPAGLSIVSSTAPEAAGLHCAAGGAVFTSGLDSNRDGTLAVSEVTATSYICNGLAAIGWVDVNASVFVLADPNTGYVADNALEVTVQLPAAPNVGDILRVSGAGAGGWKISQGAGQSIETSNLDVATIARPFTFAATPSQDWRGIAASSDGTHLAAAPSSGRIMTSADAGATWTAVGPANGWTTIASSANGRRLIAAGFNRPLLVSADYGATWNATPLGSAAWTSVASSADGRVLAAVGQGTSAFVSNDFGASWFTTTGGDDWSGVAMSADGSHIVTVANPGDIYGSVDGGHNWTQRTVGFKSWTAAAVSADGTRVVAVNGNGDVLRSTDGGVAFIASSLSPLPWSSVSTSADGGTLLVVSENDGLGSFNGASGSLFMSSDQGASWVQVQPNESWRSVALSASGDRWVAVSESYDGTGAIVTSTPTRVGSTTVGVGGSLSGRQYQAIELQFIGGGRFMVLDAIGTSFAAP